MNMNKPSGRQIIKPSRRAFTLIEVLVVVAIIILLLGLLVAGISGAFGAADRRRVAGDMHKMLAAHEEYRAQTGQYVDFQGVSNPETESISLFIEAMISVPESKKLILSISKESWADVGQGNFPDSGDGLTPDVPNGIPRYFKDPWGKPYQFRSWSEGDTAYTGAGTLPRRGTGNQRQPFIISAGEDGEFGGYTNNEPGRLAIDNILSYEIQ